MMQAKDKPFSWLVKYLEAKGMRVVKVPINWKNRVLSQNAIEFIDFYSKQKSEENYVLGFSYGAVITILTANILKPKKIFLCSLSPDFSEDREWMKTIEVKKYIGTRRFADTLTRSGRKIAQKLMIPSVVFYGEAEGKEFPQLVKRCKETVRLAKNSKLIVVEEAPHDINFPAYREAIKKVI